MRTQAALAVFCFVAVTTVSCMKLKGKEASTCIARGAEREDTVVISPGVQNPQWGNWGKAQFCAAGAFARSVRVKVQPFQGDGQADDTGVNGIEFLCSDGCVITSTMGSSGEFAENKTCPGTNENGFVDSLQFKSSENLGKGLGENDNTGIDGLRWCCSAGWGWTQTINGYKGSLGERASCPVGYAIYGFQAKLQDGGQDKKGMTDAKFFCAPIATAEASTCLASKAEREDTVVISPGVQNPQWGNWGEAQFCAAGAFARSVRVKVQPFQGDGEADDTGVNGIEFLCSDGCVMTSTMGSFGEFADNVTCPGTIENGFVDSLQFKSSEGFGNGLGENDNTGIDGLRWCCSAGWGWTQTINGYKGSLGERASCPSGSAIYGFQAKLQDGGQDKKGMTNAKFFCAPF